MDLTLWLSGLLTGFAEFAGVLALIVVVAAALKKFGVVDEAQGELVLKGLGLLAFAAFAVAQGIFGVVIPPAINGIAAILAQLLAALLGISVISDRVLGTRLGERATSFLLRK